MEEQKVLSLVLTLSKFILSGRSLALKETAQHTDIQLIQARHSLATGLMHLLSN